MDMPGIRYEPLQGKDFDAAREMLNRDDDAGKIFLRVLEKWPGSLVAAFLGDTLAALAQVERSLPQSYLAVFVSPGFRRQGIGSAMVRHAEEELQGGGTRKIRASFHADNNAASAFAKKNGYGPYFQSACMHRTGDPFPLGSLPVRQYEDEDYLACQALNARAFHEMRVRVGRFPDSAIARPSEKERQEWREDAQNRFVYEENGVIVALGHIDGNELSSISVHTEFHGRGIGRRFVMFLCNEIYGRGNTEVELSCVVGNNARNLYESLGFREQYAAEFVRKML
jgi:mycothiol synthase